MKKYIFISLFCCIFLFLAGGAKAQTYVDAKTLTVIGKADNSISRFYHRIDTAKYNKMPNGVKSLFTQSAGMVIAFKTNSKHIYAKWTTKTASGMANMNPIGQKGLDLYIKRDERFQYAGVGKAKLSSTEHTATIVENIADGEKECLLYLPLYEEITHLEIGVTVGSYITPMDNPFRGKVLVYGSSITQGASASRPGLAYPSIIGRNTGIHFINFGLSGSAKMESTVADMITSFNADAYILDCVPNSNSTEITGNTASLVKKIRSRHPSSPIIMVQSVIRELGNFNLTTRNNVQTQNQLFRQEYDKLVAEGISGLTLITAEDLLGHDHEGTIDGTHPNDLGFERMIEVIQPIITPIINQAIENEAANDVVEEPEPEPEDYMVSTLAGGGSKGDITGEGVNALFNYVQCVALDSKGNIICSDRGNHKIKKITPEGVVSIIAGTTLGYKDGNALTEAQFYNPYGIAIDNNDNIYVADISNNKIRKISPEGVVSTVAGTSSGFTDGDALAVAQFKTPIGIIIDQQGNLIISDYANHSIRKISGGIVSTIAGNGVSGHKDGTGNGAQFSSPIQGVMDANGNFLIPDRGNNCLRKVTPAGVVTTIAGQPKNAGYVDGDALTEAKFKTPSCIAFDLEGNLLIADHSNHRIRIMTPDGQVGTLAGNGINSWKDGPASIAEFSEPYGIAVNVQGDIFVGEMAGSSIRKITKSKETSVDELKVRDKDFFIRIIPGTGIELTPGHPVQEKISVFLYDATGKLLKHIANLKIDNENESTIIPVQLSKGVYFLQLTGDNYYKSIKFAY